jgi:hypothetical protein
VRAGAVARAAGTAESLPRRDLLAELHADLGQMRVERLEALAHVDEHDVAVIVESGHIADRFDEPGCGGIDIE